MVWKALHGVRRTGGLIMAAGAVAGLNDRELNMLAADLLAKGGGFTPFQEWIAVYVKHETLKRGKKTANNLAVGEEGSAYRLITDRESRRMAAKNSLTDNS